MQTLDQLLTKIINLQTASEVAGHKPDIVHLTREDEVTLIVHEWKKLEPKKKPPGARSSYTTLASLVVMWDAAETSVRSFTHEERQFRQARDEQAYQNMGDHVDRLWVEVQNRRSLT